MSCLSKPAQVADSAIEKRPSSAPKPIGQPRAKTDTEPRKGSQEKTNRFPIDQSRQTQSMFNTKELVEDEIERQDSGADESDEQVADRKHAQTMPIGSDDLELIEAELPPPLGEGDAPPTTEISPSQVIDEEEEEADETVQLERLDPGLLDQDDDDRTDKL